MHLQYCILSLSLCTALSFVSVVSLNSLQSLRKMKRSSAAQAQESRLLLLHAAISIMSNILMMQLMCFLPYPAAESFHFQHSSFNSTADLELVTEDSWYTGQGPLVTNSSVWLTPDPRVLRTEGVHSYLGRVVYKDPIQFMSTSSDMPKKVASFNTSFSFQIITTLGYGRDGSGMAFFISTSHKAPAHSDTEGLGLLDRSRLPDLSDPSFFAVEFDTYQGTLPNATEEEEPSSSHIGIDINSLLSRKVIDTSPKSSSGFYPQLFLYNNYTFTAWIEYASSLNLIQVWMTNNSSSQRPPQPCLQLSFDLSSIFWDFMYVGFSGANYQSWEGHALYSWSFYSEDLNTSVPTPSPSQSSHTSPSPHTSQSPHTSPSPKHRKLLVPLAVTVSTLLALGVLGIVFFCIFRRRRRRRMSANHTIQLGFQNHNNKHLASTPRYSYNELRRAARGFTDQNKVGEGGFSSVYKATLADGSLMAIKKLKEGVRKEAEFSSEMNIISSIRHRNLLELQGWCYEKGEAMLLYKYMSNGSLDTYLYGEKRGTLQSETRLRVLGGVALALDYLHSGLGGRVLHRDVKAANVLLTENFEAMLGDFGLARLISHDQGAVTMTAVGTPGYVAPEVIYAGKVTDKADVYSFGVLALEIACGRRAIERTTMNSEEARLVDWVWLLHQGNQLMEALDPGCISMDIQKEDWRCVLHVALMCCSPSPEARPSMRQVTQALNGDTLLLMQPLPATRPLYPTAPSSLPSASGSSVTTRPSSGTVTISASTSSTFG